MKRIIITEEEKNSIIRMYYKGKLNETKGAQNMSPNCVGASVECFGGTNGDWDGTMPLVKKIANYIKGYNERKPFYTNKMIELFSQLSDEQIIELLKNK